DRIPWSHIVVSPKRKVRSRSSQRIHAQGKSKSQPLHRGRRNGFVLGDRRAERPLGSRRRGASSTRGVPARKRSTTRRSAAPKRSAMTRKRAGGGRNPGRWSPQARGPGRWLAAAKEWAYAEAPAAKTARAARDRSIAAV